MGELSADQVIELLNLNPLSFEGGYFRRTWLSDQYDKNGKSAGSAIFYLFTNDEMGFSILHSLPTDETYHFYCGSPVELWLFPNNNGEPEKIILGNRLEKGEIPQFTVPANHIQGARLICGEWALVGTTMAPAFDQSDFVPADKNYMIHRFPSYEKIIKELIGIQKV